MKLFKQLSIVVGLLIGSYANATDFSLLGAVTVTNYNLSPAPASASLGTAYGIGGTLGMDLSPFLSVESGVLFLSHSFSFTNAGLATTVATGFAEVPVWLRISPISFFSINFGPYAAIPTSASPGTTSWDYGFHLGAGLRFGLVPTVKLRVDALYEYGLANLTSSGLATQNARDILVLAGIMFELF